MSNRSMRVTRDCIHSVGGLMIDAKFNTFIHTLNLQVKKRLLVVLFGPKREIHWLKTFRISSVSSIVFLWYIAQISSLVIHQHSTRILSYWTKPSSDSHLLPRAGTVNIKVSCLTLCFIKWHITFVLFS